MDKGAKSIFDSIVESKKLLDLNQQDINPNSYEKSWCDIYKNS